MLCVDLYNNFKIIEMKEKILALLQAKFAGVRKDGLNHLARSLALQATNEEEASALIEKLTKEQVETFVKEYRAEVDKEVSEGNKTFETNLKKKFDLVERKAQEPGSGEQETKNDDGTTDIATMIKNAIAEAVKPLQTELEKYKAGDIAKTRLQTLNEKLAACKDDNFKAQTLKDFQRMQFDSDEAFTEYLTEKETAISMANQNMANAALGGHGKPIFAQKTENGISKGVADYVESKKTESNELSGKEV